MVKVRCLLPTISVGSLVFHSLVVLKNGLNGLKAFRPFSFQDDIENLLSNHTDTITRENHQQPLRRNWTHEWLVQGTGGEPARLLFVHVGKTGGVTLINSIPIDKKAKRHAITCMMEAPPKNKKHKQATTSFETAWNKCYRKKQKHAQARLAQQTISHKHMWSPGYSKQQSTWVLYHVNTFLISVRNPVSRIVSAFNFHRNGNVLWGDKHNKTTSVFFRWCFNTSIDQVAQRLLNESRTTSKNSSHPSTTNSFELGRQILRGIQIEDSCLALAKIVLSGRGQFGDGLDQFRYNYQYYRSVTMHKRPRVPVVVVRTEHLWDDVGRLEAALGGSGDQFRQPQGHDTHGSETYAVQTGLSSAAAKQAICCVIYKDMDAFQAIVLAALNLNHSEKVETLRAPMTDCGVVPNEDEDLVSAPFSWRTWHSQTCVSETRE